MGESSSRSGRRRSRRGSKRRSRDRRSKPTAAASTSSRRDAREDAAPPASPPSYSVEENSEGDWVNSRLNVEWPQQVHGGNNRRYLALADSDNDSTSDRKQSERRSRKKRSKREKKERKEKKRDLSKKSSSSSLASTTARSPPSAKKESQYISLSMGSEQPEEPDRSKRTRRERKRMTVQTSPQISKHSRSGFVTDEDGKKIDSVVFDTRSEMMRYKKSDDILPAKGRSARAKKPVAGGQRENDEYNRYYVGVKSRRNVESKLKQPGDFSLYYEKPGEGELPSSVNLQIAYLSSGEQPYHFPIQCFEGVDGHKRYVVMQNKSDGKMFTSILSLVKHYSLYSNLDTSSGRLETFAVPC